MNIQHVEQLRSLCVWVKNTTGKSVNLEINIWNHKHSENPQTEYRIWIEDIFNQSTKDSDMLIALIPYIKTLCTKKTILENNDKLKEVAA